MMFKRKTWGFIFVVLALMVILSGCESGSEVSDYKDVRRFAGSVGPGDFINVEVNVTEGYLDYEVRDLSNSSPTVDPVRIEFSKPGSDFYVMDNGDRFLMLGDEVLIATDKDFDDNGDEIDTGEEFITALKEMNSNDLSEYIGKYNIITSLEGAPGTVELKSDGFAYIWIDLNGDKNIDDTDDENDEYFSSEYEYDSTYKAIRIIENDKFKHYGVFLDGKIGIFDSYMYDAGSWTGDGMSILVEQNSSSELNDFAGTYDFIDVDGYNGQISIEVINDTIKITDPENNTTDPITVSYFEENNNTGLWSFEAALSEKNDLVELWTMMIFEKDGNEILVIGSTEDEDGDGMFGIDGDESHGGMIIGVKE